MAEERLMRSMLLDFYGELLTPRQRQCYDLHYNEDLSLSEIAEQCGVSRQGVWDNIRRAESALSQMEEKTGLIRRFGQYRETLERVSAGLKEADGLTDGRARELIRRAREEIEALGGEG